MEIETSACLKQWFDSRLESMECRWDTRAYVVGVLASVTAASDMSQESVVLAFDRAKRHGDFAQYQKIGDWVLWVDIVKPKLLENHHEVAETIARLSYLSCHKLLRRQWLLYEELADALPVIAKQARYKLLSTPGIVLP